MHMNPLVMPQVHNKQANCYLTGAKIVLREEVLEDASLLIEDGLISAINPESVRGIDEINLRGKYLLPGLIDLHCDALEKEIEPRAGVFFPLPFAIAQADKRNAMAGITTPFHALSFADEELGVRNNNIAAEIARMVHTLHENTLVDNRVHCRYEITDPTGLEILLQLMDKGFINLLSLMDHTPGQGQFKDLAAYQDFFASNYSRSAEEVMKIAEQKLANGDQAQYRIEALATKARNHAIPLASHDDDCISRVEIMNAVGVTLSEFPINLETAQAAQHVGMHTIFGAPNLLRGKSQSGSMKALEAIEANVATCLCGDYSPGSLLPAIFKLPEISDLNLWEATRLVTDNPAQAIGLDDRGTITTGKRADLVIVTMVGNLPQASCTFAAGKPVFQAGFLENSNV